MTPAQAQKAPDKFTQEVLVKTTLLTFNDANVTQNYSVLHAKLSKQFREQFPPERLKEVFKPFVDQKIDFDIIAAKTPIADKEAEVDDRGVLARDAGVGKWDRARGIAAEDDGSVDRDFEAEPVRIGRGDVPGELRGRVHERAAAGHDHAVRQQRRHTQPAGRAAPVVAPCGRRRR